MLIRPPLRCTWFASVAAVALLSPGAACDPPTHRASADPRDDAAQQAAPPAPAPAGGSIAQRVSFREARNHYIDVEASFPTAGRAELELMMPVWTPGSYLVREYSRNVEAFAALGPDGARLAVAKTRKNRWQVTTGGADPVTVRYRVYAAEMSVRTSWVSDDMAVLNGAATFLAPVGDLARPHEVAFELPTSWTESITALPAQPGGSRHHYLARDYDTLIDSPVLLGNPIVREFEVAGIRHRLAFAGDTGLWDPDRAARDVARVVETQRAFWRQLPYRSYDFLQVLVDGASGGLEHLDSNLILASPWAMRRKKDHARWLGVVSHELFHAWNVKRMRPAELGPFDYENEVYTRSLWLAEGVTSYYDDLLVKRAGLIDRDQYLAALSDQIRALESGPGREVQPLALSSFDAWIKFYRPDENTSNATVDYYSKGAVVGFLLDAEIRRATGGQRSLDDVLRLAYGRYSGARGYRPEEVRQAAEEVSGRDLDTFWRDHVDGVAPLDYGPALDYYGLRLAARSAGEGAAAVSGEEPAGDLGLETRVDSGRLRVTRVRRGGPGWAGGVQPGDEILAVDERRVPPDGLATVLSRYRPGERLVLLVSRWNLLRRIPVVLGSAGADRFELEMADAATAPQRAHLSAWLGAP